MNDLITLAPDPPPVLRLPRSDPANRLANGEAKDLMRAVQLYYEALLDQMSGADAEQQYHLRLEEMKMRAAQRIWTEERRRDRDLAVLRSVERLYSLGLDDWADALASGDYTRLAL